MNIETTTKATITGVPQVRTMTIENDTLIVHATGIAVELSPAGIIEWVDALSAAYKLITGEPISEASAEPGEPMCVCGHAESEHGRGGGFSNMCRAKSQGDGLFNYADECLEFQVVES